MRNALSKEEVKQAVERSGKGRVPVMLAKWWGEGLYERYESALDELDRIYPDDVCMLWYQDPGHDVSYTQNPEYRFGHRADYRDAERHSIGQEAVLLPDWEELDACLAHFPNPCEPGNFDSVRRISAENEDKYRIGCWWRVFHEKLWTFRGMENLMMDYYDNMDGLKRLGRALLEFYKPVVDQFAAVGCDAIFTSDDLGHQSGPMMSPAVFHELYFPLYQEFAAYVHEKGMKLFLHSCGDNTLLMPDLIAAGVDVLHPIQKGCMDMEQIAKDYGDQITFLAGIDMQHILIHGTPEEVRMEVRYMKRVFDTGHGGLLLAMGNGIIGDTPLENIKAALDEMYNGENGEG